MSTAIDERIVLEIGNIRYRAEIEHEGYAQEPDWLEYKIYAPDLRRFEDDGAPGVYVSDAPDELLAVEEEYGEWGEKRMARFAKLYRYCDPAGIYLAATYDQDRYAGDAITIHGAADEDRAQGNILLYIEGSRRAELLGSWADDKSEEEIATNLRAMIEEGAKTWNAWANGEVYAWTLFREVVDEDDPDLIIEKEHIDSCGGYYGQSEWPYMYECALDDAEADVERRQEERCAFMAAESGMALLAV